MGVREGGGGEREMGEREIIIKLDLELLEMVEMVEISKAIPGPV